MNRDLDSLEEVALKFYDQAYAFCDRFGIVKTAKKLTAKQRTVRRPRPTHNLICSCRKCEVSIKTYIKRMKAA